MNARHKVAAAGIALALGAGAIGATAALGGDDGDAGEQATGPAADRAERAALARFPGARVTSVERDADGAAEWEAEVTRPDGTVVDVSLDGNYRILAIDEESDRDEGDRDDDGDDERDDAREDEQRDDQEREDSDDAPATDAAAQRAGDAALARYPGGRVTSIERDSDDGEAWEVEVTRSDGSRVDVSLDADLRILAVGDPE